MTILPVQEIPLWRQDGHETSVLENGSSYTGKMASCSDKAPQVSFQYKDAVSMGLPIIKMEDYLCNGNYIMRILIQYLKRPSLY